MGSGGFDLGVMGSKATKPSRTPGNARERTRTHRAGGGADGRPTPPTVAIITGGHLGHPDARRQPTNTGPPARAPGVPIAAGTAEQLQKALGMPYRPLQATNSSTSPRCCGPYRVSTASAICPGPEPRRRQASGRGTQQVPVGVAETVRSWPCRGRVGVRSSSLSAWGPWSGVGLWLGSVGGRSGSLVGRVRSWRSFGVVWPPHVCTKEPAQATGGALPPSRQAQVGRRSRVNAGERTGVNASERTPLRLDSGGDAGSFDGEQVLSRSSSWPDGARQRQLGVVGRGLRARSTGSFEPRVQVSEADSYGSKGPPSLIGFSLASS